MPCAAFRDHKAWSRIELRTSDRRPERAVRRRSPCHYVRRLVAPMMPPTIRDKTMLPMIEIRSGEPNSASTTLIPTSTRMKIRNCLIRTVWPCAHPARDILPGRQPPRRRNVREGDSAKARRYRSANLPRWVKPTRRAMWSRCRDTARAHRGVDEESVGALSGAASPVSKKPALLSSRRASRAIAKRGAARERGRSCPPSFPPRVVASRIGRGARFRLSPSSTGCSRFSRIVFTATRHHEYHDCQVQPAFAESPSAPRTRPPKKPPRYGTYAPKKLTTPIAAAAGTPKTAAATPITAAVHQCDTGLSTEIAA